MFAIPAFAHIARIPARIMVPIVIVLCVVGTFSVNGSIVETWIMLGCGVIGFFMKLYGYSPAATVIALVMPGGGNPAAVSDHLWGRSSYTRSVSLLLVIIIGLLIAPRWQYLQEVDARRPVSSSASAARRERERERERDRWRLTDTTGRPRRIAMITGAGRNIGRAIALDLASREWISSSWSAATARGAGVAGEVRALGRRAMVGVTDVRDEEAISGVVERAREELGPVNVPNNAAVRREAPFLELPVAEWREVLDIILDGTFVCSRAVLPGMLDSGWGGIVNLAGLAAQTGAPQRRASSRGRLA